MSRLLEEPLPLQIELNERGEPAHMRFVGAGPCACPRGCPVLEVCSRWRVDDDWWRVPISRMYYKLRTPTSLIELYQDLNSGEWFLERVHD